MSQKRICVSCRCLANRDELICLTVRHTDNQVCLNQHDGSIHGRSAYLCKATGCIQQALKGTRLKVALEGKQKRLKGKKRLIAWPLESQLIKLINTQCTEGGKTCQNTLRKEGSE